MRMLEKIKAMSFRRACRNVILAFLILVPGGLYLIHFSQNAAGIYVMQKCVGANTALALRNGWDLQGGLCTYAGESGSQKTVNHLRAVEPGTNVFHDAALDPDCLSFKEQIRYSIKSGISKITSDYSENYIGMVIDIFNLPGNVGALHGAKFRKGGDFPKVK